MRVLLSWLADYIEWTGTARELAHCLSEVGLLVAAVEDLGRGDAILDVEVPSNRGDCMSHLGISREAAGALGQPFRSIVEPAVPRAEGAEPASRWIAAGNEAPDACGLLTARVIVGVDNTRPTPGWIARRLAALGVRAVNPVVDLTNFVLLARGQPLHAYDRSRLAGGMLVARRARAGEVLVTLDGKRRELPAGIPVLADAERPVGIAGVMGGRDTEVGPRTTEVVLESARFSPAEIRASALALGLATEASARFSRRIDPAEVDRAALRCAALVEDACGGTVASGSVRAGPDDGARAPLEVRLRHERLRRILGGGSIAREEVAADLRSLSFEEVRRDAASLTVRVPEWRGDVALEEDLVEEVARVRGYGRIPVQLTLPVRPLPVPARARRAAALREALRAEGFHEALTLPFVAGDPVLDDASPWTAREAVRVENPVRAEEPLLRRSLLGPLLRCLERNRARGVEGARLFEASTAFLPGADRGSRPEERRLVAGAVEGDFLDARGGADAALESLGLASRVVAAPAAAPPAPLAPGRTATLSLDGVVVGWVGEVGAPALDRMGLHREGFRAAAFELDLAALEAAAPAAREVRLPPDHPRPVRDLAFVLPDACPWAAVAATVAGAAGPLLRDAVPFDEYRGKGIEAGHRSLAVRLVFGRDDRTLGGEEIEAAVRAVVDAVARAHGGRLRA